jgi:hypothetical protein
MSAGKAPDTRKLFFRVDINDRKKGFQIYGDSHILTRPFRWLSIIFFISALVGIFALWMSDGLHQLRFTSVHQRMGALPLICIGLSYISFQLSAGRQPGELVKGLLLGIAFVFWGSEQLLPSSSLVTIMDSVVITIFVVDLGLIIVEHLKRKDHEIL